MSKTKAPLASRRRGRTAGVAAAGAASIALVAGAFVALPGAQAAPAHQSAALAPAVAQAATATTVTTKFRWADGSAVKATVVPTSKATSVPPSGIQKRYLASPTWDSTQGVLADGRAIGLDNGKVQVLHANNTRQNYYTGKLPAPIDRVQVQGNTVYGVTSHPQYSMVYEFSGPGKPVKILSKLTGDFGNAEFTVANGRVYWRDYVVSTRGIVQSTRVLSRAAGGGSSRVEATNASTPTSSLGGVAVVTHAPKPDRWDGGPVTGLRKLGGGTLVKYTGTWPVVGSGPDDNVPGLYAGGNMAAVVDIDRKGVMVMDLVNRRAWLVTPRAGDTSTIPVFSGTRAAWQWINPANGHSPSYGEAMFFDLGKLRRISSGNPVYNVSVNGKAIEYSTFEMSGREWAVGGLLP